MYRQTILGSTGIIGTILANELRKYTYRIRLVSRNPVMINPSDELMVADLTIPDMVEKAIAGSDVVYLVVGLEYNTEVWQERWPRLMRFVINACIKYRSRMVFLDNVYMYDAGSISHMTETSPVNPPSGKGQVRMNLVNMIMENVKSGKLLALIARSADFYGPGNGNILLNQVVYYRLRKGKTPLWFVTAGKKHSFTFTADVARGMALLGNTDDAYNQVWHLPTDHNILTIRQIIDIFAKEMEVRSKVNIVPGWMVKLMGYFNPLLREFREMLYQYDRDYFFDSSKFLNRFDFKPATYQEGIRNTIQGLKTGKHYAENRIINV